jgi:GT2 family glycosyltransferase
MATPPARVAVITRTIDRPEFLRRSLASLLAQTYPHWQWVIVTPNPEPSVTRLLAENAPAPSRSPARSPHSPP